MTHDRETAIKENFHSFHAVNAVPPSRERMPINWVTVQFAQFEHDEKYHREISRLPIQDRLRHMAMHFAKYAGRLQEDCADQSFKRTAIDALVIAVSSANILNIDLSTRAVPGIELPVNRGSYTRRLAISAGRMAGACERLDHLEDFPFRKKIEEEVLAILALGIALFAEEEWNPVAEMQARLSPIKAKSIFHGRL